MASLFEIVRLVTLVLIGIAFVLNVTEVFHMISNHTKDPETISYVSIALLVLFIGGYGSYTNRRTYLIGFALIMIIAIIVGFASKAAVYSVSFSVTTAILALVQAEMLRRSF